MRAALGGQPEPEKQRHLKEIGISPAIIGMNRFGISGNLMSLGALDFGLMVDGGVVVIETTLLLLSQRRAALGRARGTHIMSFDDDDRIVVGAQHGVEGDRAARRGAQRVAVRRGLRRGIQARVAARAGPSVDDQGLAKRSLKALADDAAETKEILNRVKELEHQGYEFEAAEASLALLIRSVLDNASQLMFSVEDYHVSMRGGHGTPVTEATVKVRVGANIHHEVAEGDGPVNALDGALR